MKNFQEMITLPICPVALSVTGGMLAEFCETEEFVEEFGMQVFAQITLAGIDPLSIRAEDRGQQTIMFSIPRVNVLIVALHIQRARVDHKNSADMLTEHWLPFLRVFNEGQDCLQDGAGSWSEDGYSLN